MTCSNSVKEGWSYSGLNNTFFFFIGSLLHIVSLLWRLPWNSQLSFSVYCGSNIRKNLKYFVLFSSVPVSGWLVIITQLLSGSCTGCNKIRDQGPIRGLIREPADQWEAAPHTKSLTWHLHNCPGNQRPAFIKISLLLSFTCMHQELSKKNPPKRLLCG